MLVNTNILLNWYIMKKDYFIDRSNKFKKPHTQSVSVWGKITTHSSARTTKTIQIIAYLIGTYPYIIKSKIQAEKEKKTAAYLIGISLKIKKCTFERTSNTNNWYTSILNRYLSIYHQIKNSGRERKKNSRILNRYQSEKKKVHI